MNPITRRPVPGRGRPRKQPPGDQVAPGTPGTPSTGVAPPPVSHPGVAPLGPPPGAPPGAPGVHPLYPNAPPVAGVPPGVPVGTPLAGVPVPPHAVVPAVPGTPGAPAMPNIPSHGLPVSQGPPQPPPSQVNQGVAPQAQMTAPQDLAVDPNLEEDTEEHASKRQRLSDDSQDPSIEDEAVLNALAVHNNPETPGDYTTE